VERTEAREYAALLNRFYRVATQVLVCHDAIIDKLIGDEVMALFIQGIAGSDYRKKSIAAVRSSLRRCIAMAFRSVRRSTRGPRSWATSARAVSSTSRRSATR
jgi:class 3 adenylate cyclase